MKIEHPTSITENQPNREDSFQAFELDEYHRAVISQAEREGFNTYQITVRFIKDIMIKAARVFMVLWYLKF